ncbi:four-carbon acid sugar kinase family protein (plasmid) [Rhizobium grahamii]|uniref:Four-carbon acid sugar kinase family protein n=1 Tax=Rhizobium grahamii TaxID=1120045 RepID=A0A5Q0CC56_9HYPH|nr:MULTISPECIES: four-carbon acid sugar kinase family protein [Rhizobium]QFY63458.1 four-carbon acid sugar kinase family protein [Rhizobium grahamii]QRM51779.1 four-carbon acid sugar kinase family protein [Rhizobium sp. BG6]
MTLQVAVIADDLTGALDTGTPFVDAGLSVAVAIEVDAIADALASGCDVVVVNTASRALPEKDAARRVKAAAEALLAASPRIVLKKIDSRLKGNVAAESAALASVFGHEAIVVAPAIPDQQRLTRNGSVVGRGVDVALPIADLFDGHDWSILVRDAETDRDLDGVVGAFDWTRNLAVGARGIGLALARKIGGPDRVEKALATSSRTVFAFGSRDPITAAQMAQLEASGALAASFDAPMGRLPLDIRPDLPALLRCTGEMTVEATDVAQRFARGVKSAVVAARPEVLMVGGGDTALAVFRELGIRVLRPKGEVEAGIPWFDVTTADGLGLRCAVKSGGFGNSDSLLKLVAQNQTA